MEEIKYELIEMINNVGVDIKENDFLDLQTVMDSLQFVALICDIEERYGIQFIENELLMDNYKTFIEFVNYVVHKINLGKGGKIDEKIKKEKSYL